MGFFDELLLRALPQLGTQLGTAPAGGPPAEMPSAGPRLADQYGQIAPMVPVSPVAAPEAPTPTPIPTPMPQAQPTMIPAPSPPALTQTPAARTAPLPQRMAPPAAATSPTTTDSLTKIAPYILPALVGLASAASPVVARGVTAGANTLMTMNQMRRQGVMDASLLEERKSKQQARLGDKFQIVDKKIIATSKVPGEAPKVIYESPTKAKDLLTSALMPFIPVEKLRNPDLLTNEDLAEAGKKQALQAEAISGAKESGKLQQVINFGGYAPGGKPSAAGPPESKYGYVQNPKTGEWELQLGPDGKPLLKSQMVTGTTTPERATTREDKATTSRENRIQTEINNRMKADLKAKILLRKGKTGEYNQLRKPIEEQVRKEFGVTEPVRVPKTAEEYLEDMM